MEGGANGTESTAVLDFVKALIPFVTAALAAFLALLVNSFLDRRKADRDLLGEISVGLRSDVRQAVEVASAYWSQPGPEKLINEARIKMLEQEIRTASVLLDDGNAGKDSVEFQSAVTSFLSVLTGADFEAQAVVANQAHVRDVVGRGVALRKMTAQLRRSQVRQRTRAA